MFHNINTIKTTGEMSFTVIYNILDQKQTNSRRIWICDVQNKHVTKVQQCMWNNKLG